MILMSLALAGSAMHPHDVLDLIDTAGRSGGEGSASLFTWQTTQELEYSKSGVFM